MKIDGCEQIIKNIGDSPFRGVRLLERVADYVLLLWRIGIGTH